MSSKPTIYVDDLYDENQRLRAENERLSNLNLEMLVEYDRQRKENERLREESDARQEVLVLRDAEIERLRAALQEIVDHPAPSYVNNVARTALGRDNCH